MVRAVPERRCPWEGWMLVCGHWDQKYPPPVLNPPYNSKDLAGDPGRLTLILRNPWDLQKNETGFT